MKNSKLSLSILVVAATLTAAFAIASISIGQQAFAQGGGQQVAAPVGVNQTVAQQPGQSAQNTQPGQAFAETGIISSVPEPLPGHANHQVATVLPLRNDGAAYSGIVTWVASKPVYVQTLNSLPIDPQIIQGQGGQISQEYGFPAIAPIIGGVTQTTNQGGTQQAQNVGIVTFGGTSAQQGGQQGGQQPEGQEQPGGQPSTAGSEVFAGNALSFITLDGQPFVVSYTVDGRVSQAVQVANLQSATSIAPFEVPGQDTLQQQQQGGQQQPPQQQPPTNATG